MNTLVDQIGAEVASVDDYAKVDGVQIVVVDFLELGRAKGLAHSKAVEDAWCIATMARKKFVAPNKQ